MSSTNTKRREMPAVPEATYRRLPETPRKLTSYFDKWYERDAFLTALLVTLSSALPGVRLRYGKGHLSPHFFAFIVAAAGSGKGCVAHAFRLLDLVDQKLLRESGEVRAAWRSRRDAYERSQRSRGSSPPVEDPGPEPPERCVTVGENTTHAKLVERLASNPEGVFVGSTEADSLTQANKQQHGGFSDLLRKAFHNEPVILDRKGTGTTRIPETRLALVLSGTEDQLDGLFEGVSDGLFSRFSIYEFQAPLRYVSQRPSDRDREFDRAVEEAQGAVLALYEVLARRQSPIYLEVPPALWDRVDEAYAALFDRTFAPVTSDESRKPVSPLMAATVKRGAVVTFRVLMVLAVWRRFESGDDLESEGSVVPDDTDVESAIEIGLVYTEHALRLALAHIAALGQLPDLTQATAARRMTSVQREWWDGLPDEFASADAEAAGVAAGKGRSTVYRWLERFIQDGLLARSEVGSYTKSTSPPNETGGTGGIRGTPVEKRSVKPPRGDSGIPPYPMRPASPTNPTNPTDLLFQ